MNRRRFEREQERGQTLVLMALTMLLLVVMVCLTLAIGMKAREKIELQTLADATAFSNATATARVFNTISVWNRAQISHMVVLAGAQSHISYAGWYLGTLRAQAIGAAAAAVACGLACANPWLACMCPSCVNVGKIANAMNQEYNNTLNRFKSLDRLAGMEGRVLQTQAVAYGLAGQGLYLKHGLWIGQGGFADKMIELAVPDTTRRQEYKVSTTANIAISARELTQARATSSPYPSLPATHGTRGSDFTRNRGGVVPPFRPILIYAQNQGIGGVFIGSGAGYFGTGKHNTNDRDARESWADDEGWAVGGIVFGGCIPWFVPPTPSNAHVKSTHSSDNSDQHRWFTGSPHNGPEYNTHTMGSCGSNCPSVWIKRQEFNIDPDNANNTRTGGTAGLNDQWRQPKVMVGMQRDYSARTIEDPWNLAFRFRLNSSDTAEVDIGKNKLSSMPGKFKTQMALATGITYYHRHMQDTTYSWQEPPNFFNPFWRATLVPADIDNTGTVDIGVALGAANAQGAAAFTALKGAGFKGIQ